MAVTKQSVQAPGGLEARADTSTPSQEVTAVAEPRRKAEPKVVGWRYIGPEPLVVVVAKDVPGRKGTSYDFRNGETVNLLEGQTDFLAKDSEFEQVDPR